MSELGISQSPMSAAQIAGRLAALDATTLAAVLQAAAQVAQSPGVAAMLSLTAQGAREALQIANPNAAERYLRAQFMR
jgi:hypothetical protein